MGTVERVACRPKDWGVELRRTEQPEQIYCSIAQSAVRAVARWNQSGD